MSENVAAHVLLEEDEVSLVDGDEPGIRIVYGYSSHERLWLSPGQVIVDAVTA